MMRLVVLLATFLITAPAAQAEQRLSLGLVGIGNDPSQTAATAFATEVQHRLPNRLRIDTKSGSTLGSESDIWEGVQLGSIDIAIVSTGAIAPSIPQLGVLDLPYLFQNSAHADKVLDGPIGHEIGAGFDDRGVVFLGFVEIGFRHLTNSKRRVQSPSDVAALRIRVLPNLVYEETFKVLGADVVRMPFSGVYGALDDERIDGQENPLLRIAGAHFDQVQTYLSLTGHIFSSAAILVNAGTWHGLKRAERTALAAAAHAAMAATRRALADDEKAALATFRRKGMVITENVDRDAFIAALAPMQPVWETRFGADLLDRIRKTK